MGDKELDSTLRDLLGDYKPEGLVPNWHEFSGQLDSLHEPTDPGQDPSFDENVKESFRTYKAPEQVEGWQRIQSSLDAADNRFDEDIRKRIANFEPHYDPRTWPLFLQRLADSRFLGAKLIALKMVEVASVLLILFTVVNMGRMGKLPFNTPLYTQPVDQLERKAQSNEIANNTTQASIAELSTNIEMNAKSGKNNAKKINHNGESIPSDTYLASKELPIHKLLINTTPSLSKASDESALQSFSNQHQHSTINENAYSISFGNRNETQTDDHLHPALPYAFDQALTHDENKNAETIKANLLASADINTRYGPMDFMSTLTSPVSYSDESRFPHPTYVEERKRTHTEFGILIQVDYNRLRMPEDRLYSTGREIVFPQQGIASYGYGGGFTMAVAHPRWAIESGLIYSAKTFEPGRKIAIGTAFDNGTVEFEAMRLQLVTIPLQMRYKFMKSGPVKLYGLAGFGLNMIVQSDIDVLIKYHFPSLSAGENPNNNPSFANTIKETKRVSEQIRDGAPFSTKSYLSATAGLGIEFSFIENKTIFLQSTFQYQIPDIEFSNNNGKQIRSVSIQAGVRAPLGQ